jgi:hypothetical protein
MNRTENQIYEVSKYTDKELFDILDLINPTDRELEAKIIFLYERYRNMQNKSGNELAKFFKNIYEHFFGLDEEEEAFEVEAFEVEAFRVLPFVIPFNAMEAPVIVTALKVFPIVVVPVELMVAT